MTQHFAASWLQSLEKKLNLLSEWSWAADQSGECTTHRNLFREFFNPKFQKTLALVDDQKRIAFLGHIETNLFKFEGRTQQFPLGCLCALLQNGKESPKTKEKVTAWVTFLLSKLKEGAGSEGVAEVVEEILSASFQKFVSLVEDKVMQRLCDGLGRHLVKCDEEMQKKVIESFPALPDRIEKIMRTCTVELNAWLESAPRFPSTPLTLTDALSKTQNPLLRFFNRIKDANTKESFLVVVALALQGLRTRFRWMCAVEPELEAMGSDLQAKLFTVEGQSVMETWLSSRLKKYNLQVTTKASQILIAEPAKAQQLLASLQPFFPERSDNDGWVALDGPSNLADAVLAFLVECDSSFFCPQHTMARETLMGVLQRFGPVFDIDAQHSRVRVAVAQPPPPLATALQYSSLPVPQFPAIPPTMVPPAMSPPSMSPPSMSPPTMVPPPPAGMPSANALQVALQAVNHQTASALQVPIIKLPGAPPDPGDAAADNLVDLLLSEELGPVDPEIRAKISKISHGVYRFGEKEVTLHTQSGRLFVYRVGMMVRNCPLKTLLQEEGLVPTPEVPGSAPDLGSSATPVGSVDLSAVARIAAMSAKVSAGVTTTTAAPLQISLPFTQKSDPSQLMSKRVEAATRAMDVSRQIVRRSVNFEDEKFLRKLLAKGLKKDRTFSLAYTDFCNGRGSKEEDYKNQDRDFVATFIERNLANSINEDWAQKLIHGGDDEEKKAKKQKKKDKKDKKDKKRKASESGSSSPERNLAISTAPMQVQAPPMMSPPTMSPPAMQPPAMQPPAMQPPPMMMYPPGMGGMPGQMGMGGMVHPFGTGMMGDGAPTMAMEMVEDARPQKKAKKEKKEKAKRQMV